MATTNVNADAFVPEIWDASVYRTLEDNLVAKKICRDYSSKVSKFGDTIYMNDLADPSVSSYTGTVTYESLVSGQLALKIDKQNYYGFDITDIEAAMSNVDLKGSQTERAGYALRDACDEDIFQNTYSSGQAGTVTDASCDSATILSDISTLSRVLDEANVSAGNKWLVIPPWVKEKLTLAGVKFQINNGTNGKGGLYWAQYLDFDIYVSNNVYNSGSAASPVSYVMAGSYDSIGFAEKLMKSETLRAETAFSTHVRGLHAYGYKVVKPKELAYGTLTYTAESSI